MKLVLVGSPKGGVGKTFVTANLAYLFGQRAGRRAAAGQVALIDCDLQNALRFHFGLVSGGDEGWASRLLATGSAVAEAIDTGLGVGLVPFGRVDRRHHQELEHHFTSHSDVLHPLFAVLARQGFSVVFCDMPPGSSALVAALTPKADLQLHVLLADPASAALLPEIESGRYPGGGTKGLLSMRDARFVLNQVDWSFPLSAQIARLLSQRLGDRLLGAICRDTAVMSALAHTQPVSIHAPASDVVRDLISLADTVDWLLGASPVSAPSPQTPDFPPLLKGLF